MHQQGALPSLTLYRRNCHSYEDNYMCYLASTTQIKLVQFGPDNAIKRAFSIAIPLEPVKGISLRVNGADVYVAVASVSTINVFNRGVCCFTQALQLDTNIVHFEKGFIGVDKFDDGKAKGFAFATKNGDIFLYSITTNSVFQKSLPAPEPSNYQSFVCRYPQLCFGTQDGKIVQCKDINTSATTKGYNSSSTLPILNIGINDYNQIIATTCEGQLLIIDDNLTNHSLVSIHRSLVSRFMISDNVLYTAGEDFMLNKFQFLGQKSVKLVSSALQKNAVSLLFVINKTAWVSYYQVPRLLQI